MRLPLPPNRANARGHWSAHHAAKKAYWRACDVAAVQSGLVRGAPATPMARCALEADVYLARSMDPDNLTARLKWAIDWLVVRRWIADDGPEVLRIDAVRQFAPVTKRDRAVVMQLRPTWEDA